MGSDSVVVEDTAPALELLRGSARGLLARRWPADRAASDAEGDAALRALWHEVARQGWTGDCLPGAEGGLAAALLLLDECGRAACPLPLVGAGLAALALRDPAAAPHGDAVLASLAHGDAMVAVGLGDAGGERGGGALAVDGARVRGRVRGVEAARTASHVLFVAGASMTLLDAGAPGVTVTPTEGLAVPAVADVAVDAEPLALWPVTPDRVEVVRRVAALAHLARAAGAAARLLDLAVEHARERVQFGSPVGRFQAVQHRLADCLALLDASRLLLERAAAEHDAGADGAAYAAATAQGFAAPALRRVAREAQHVLAGVGYIEEHEAPRHFRRVMADTLRYGGAPAARARLAATVLDG